MASNATLTIKVGANVKDAAQQLQALGYNIESVKKKTDKANDSASLWSQTMKKGSEDSVRKIVEMGAKFLTVSTVITGVYKGIKSCVSEALKENEEAQKKIDKINEAWTGVQKNLGNALLDSITPALDSLYEKLLIIEEWTKKFATNSRQSSFISAAAMSLNKTGVFDSSSYSIAELESFRSNISELVSDTSKLNNEQKAHIESYKTILSYLDSEIETRKASLEVAEEATSAVEELTVSANVASTALKKTANTFKPYSEYDSLQNFVETYATGTASYQLDEKNSLIGSIKENLSTIKSIMSSSDWVTMPSDMKVTYGKYQKYLEELLEAEETVADNFHQTNSTSLGDILGGYSSSYNLKETKGKLLSTLDNLKGARRTASEDDLLYYTEAIGTVQSQLDSLAEDTSSAWQDAFSDIYSSAKSCFSGIFSFMDAYYDRQISDINKSEMAEEEKNAKINELEKKKFEAQQANSYANATISFAEGMVDIWSKYGASPWIGAALTALLTANTGLQFATISQQTYTPSLAEGGIITSPTHAYIGEGAENEAVIPLSKLEDFVNRDSEGGAIYLNITCNGNSSEADVFRAIERAQRTGLLPHWRYA